MKYNNCLILGAAGFIGSHLVNTLVKDYPELNVHIILKNKPNMFTSMLGNEDVLNNVNIIFGDITDYKLVEFVVAEYEINYIINLAALSIVRVCNEAPLVAFYNNVYSTAVLAEIARRYSSVKHFITSTCYDDKTRAMTRNGLKKYNEIQIGDEVLSINPDTKEYEYTKVKDIIVEKYNGKMIHFNSNCYDVMVTPNHKMLVENKDKYEFIEAKNLLNKRVFKPAFGHWSGSNTLEHTLSNIQNGNKIKKPIDLESLFYLTGIFIGDGCIQQQFHETKTGLKRENYLSQAKDTVTGRFKKLEKQAVSYSHSNVIHLYIPDKDSCRADVIEAIESLGLPWGTWKHMGEGALYISSAELVELFKYCGTGALNKCIPYWAKDANELLLNRLLQGIQDSDGSKVSKVIATSSETLLEDCIELGYKLGRPVSISKRKYREVKIKNRPINSQQGYFVNIRKKQGSIYNKHIHEVDYNGIIWCLTLEKNKNFIVERNGKTIISGNSDKSYGESKSLPYMEDDTTLKGMRPYEATKTLSDLWAQMYQKNYGTPITVFRSANVFGPADPNLSRLIPQVCTSIAKDKNPWLYKGVNDYVREFVYIDDVVDFIINLMECGDEDPSVIKECYNLGSGWVYRVEDMVQKIIDISGKDLQVDIKEKELDFYEIKEQYLSLEKSANMLGWAAKSNLDEALVDTYNYYYQLVTER